MQGSSVTKPLPTPSGAGVAANIDILSDAPWRRIEQTQLDLRRFSCRRITEVDTVTVTHDHSNRQLAAESVLGGDIKAHRAL